MALDKPTFNQQIRKAYEDGWKTFIAVLDNNATSANPVEKPQPVAISQAATVFANQIADAIDAYIKSADIIVPAGIDVSVNASSVVSGGDAAPAAAEGSATPPAAGAAATLTPVEVADQINAATYTGKSTANSPKATIS
jgi:hypothetical protein